MPEPSQLRRFRQKDSRQQKADVLRERPLPYGRFKRSVEQQIQRSGQRQRRRAEQAEQAKAAIAHAVMDSFHRILHCRRLSCRSDAVMITENRGREKRQFPDNPCKIFCSAACKCSRSLRSRTPITSLPSWRRNGSVTAMAASPAGVSATRLTRRSSASGTRCTIPSRSRPSSASVTVRGAISSASAMSAARPAPA